MARFVVTVEIKDQALDEVYEALEGRVDRLELSSGQAAMVVEASDDYSASSHVRGLLRERGIVSTLRTRRVR